MKTNLTKNDYVYILEYYNIQVPNSDDKIIEMADKYIEKHLCKCIRNNSGKVHFKRKKYHIGTKTKKSRI